MRKSRTSTSFRTAGPRSLRTGWHRRRRRKRRSSGPRKFSRNTRSGRAKRDYRPREEAAMPTVTRRSILRGAAAVAAAGTLQRPYIANAAATTAEVWWAQGFVPEEDLGFKKVVADYGKASGNTI